ncbi:elongation factor 1-beta [Candidatus Pacearchaeota archaeon]|nr:elongation factor 1-beta [Candidatus Pacearchaeota archaeon]
MPNTAVIIVKIMPESPSVDLNKMKETVKHKMEANGAKAVTFEEKPVAFGLKSLTLKMAFPEEKGTDFVEQELSKVPHVSSVTIEDYRRAFG